MGQTIKITASRPHWPRPHRIGQVGPVPFCMGPMAHQRPDVGSCLKQPWAAGAWRAAGAWQAAGAWRAAPLSEERGRDVGLDPGQTAVQCHVRPGPPFPSLCSFLKCI